MKYLGSSKLQRSILGEANLRKRKSTQLRNTTIWMATMTMKN
jgi:hypothetical protein